MISKLIIDTIGLYGTIKELLVQRYCYQLIVPEYKVRHLASSMYELQKWYEQYPEDCEKIMLFPKCAGF